MRTFTSSRRVSSFKLPTEKKEREKSLSQLLLPQEQIELKKIPLKLSQCKVCL